MTGDNTEASDGESGDYLPIADYGVVGNLETVALVSRRGSVDWLCLPHVESPSTFAAVLDAERGGRFAVRPAASFEASRRYLDHTNVLVSTFETASGTVEVTDIMPVRGEITSDRRGIHRRVECIEGAVELSVTFDPRFDYARDHPRLEATEFGMRASGDTDSVALTSPAALSADGSGPGDGPATGTLAVEAGTVEWFSVCHEGGEVSTRECERALDDTVAFWRDWGHECEGVSASDRRKRADGSSDSLRSSGGGPCRFAGEYHDEVVRSELALKLLTHRETGAVAAAPTTSLPESIGGVRNWDYRYNWLRDAAFTVAALANLGHGFEAEAYVDWFLGLCDADDPASLQPVYGLHGRRDLAERTLDHLEGYRGSAPVRVGNGAHEQTQLDNYGELVLAVDEAVECGATLSTDDWANVCGVVDHAADAWTEPGSGIWEVRTEPRQFVFSKVMCWVALDRGLELADRFEFDAPTDRWKAEQSAIRETVLDRGYDADRASFVRTLDGDHLDATALLLPVVGFLPFDDDRVRSTVDTVEAELGSDGLVRRYTGDDGLPGGEGAFLWCSFWLVDALALGGRVERARDTLREVTGYANDLGLLAEEADPDDGSLLGNFPQGFSHVGLLNSALYLGAVTGERHPDPEPMALRLGDVALR